MLGAAGKPVTIQEYGKETAWDRFWRCHGWRLLGRVMAVLGALELIGILGLSLAQAEGFLLTLFFLCAIAPVLITGILALVFAVGFVLSAIDKRNRRARRSRGAHAREA